MSKKKEGGLIVLATLHRFGDLADGGTSIVFHTQELNDLKFLQIRAAKQKFGVLYFREGENQNIPDELANIDIDVHNKPKSLSQRLRNTLYYRWSRFYQEDYPEFDDYYKSVMNGLINHYGNEPE